MFHFDTAIDKDIRGSVLSRRSLVQLTVAAGLGLAAPHAAYALTTQQKLNAARYNYEQAEEALKSIHEEYARLAGELSKIQAQIADITVQIEAKEAEIRTTEQHIEDKQRECERIQSNVAERMSASYKRGSQNALDLMLSATSIEELTSTIYYLDKMGEADERMVSDLRRLKAELEEQKAVLQNQQAELVVKRSEFQALEAQQAEQVNLAQAKQNEAEEVVANLSSEVQSLVKQRDAELEAARAAAEEARRIEAERKKQQASQGSSASKPNRVTVTGQGPLSSVVNAAYRVPSPGSGLCAAWVTNVFRTAGIGSFGGNACDMYNWYCGYPFTQIKPGMIVAVPTAPYGAAVVTYGHVGVYLGNGIVRHNQSGVVKDDSLTYWFNLYNKTATPLCGWLGGVALV